MEPIFFEPVYKNVIWGGNRISKIFKRNVPEDDIGESWEMSAHPNGLSKIICDDSEHKDLLELFNDKSVRKDIFGTNCVKFDKFPILIKFIDANKNLSIQVHPNNEYAKIHENDSGKNEVWYIMDCKENAKIVCGLNNNVTKENLAEALEHDIENNVKFINVHKGDFISIPAGTIHAVGEGVLLCEVQQSSDITYRVYDWNRLDKNGKPRELHKQKALEVIKLSNDSKPCNYKNITANKKIYGSNAFNIDIVNVSDKNTYTSCDETFFAYVVIEGQGKLESNGFEKEIDESSVFLIPSSLGDYSISGNLKLLKVYL